MQYNHLQEEKTFSQGNKSFYNLLIVNWEIYFNNCVNIAVNIILHYHLSRISYCGIFGENRKFVLL